MTDKSIKKKYNNNEARNSFGELFENLPEMMRVSEVANVLNISVKTVYDWRYRKREEKVPTDLFVKLNGLLFLNKKRLVSWIHEMTPN